MSIPKSQIEAIQTIPPYTMTEPRQVWKVSAKDPIGSSIFKSTLNIVLYCDHNMANDHEEGSGWHVAGWIKESLSRALRDEPMLSGRLRRGEDGVGDLEIVTNDSGARLFEATIDISLQDLLALDDVEKAESELVYWKDIDELSPQFSPLFYVQVTNFQCGGYTIGISSSILFANILIMDNFLQKWSKIHRDMLPKNKESKIPIFYIPKLKAPSSNLNGLFPSTTRDRVNQTMIFKINQMEDLKDNNLALICLEEAEKKLEIGTKISSEFVLLVKESPEKIKVQKWKKNEVIGISHLVNGLKLNSVNLKDYMGKNEVSFREEGKATTTVSYWIGSGDIGVQTIAIPSFDKQGNATELSIIVIIP